MVVLPPAFSFFPVLDAAPAALTVVALCVYSNGVDEIQMYPSSSPHTTCRKVCLPTCHARSSSTNAPLRHRQRQRPVQRRLPILLQGIVQDVELLQRALVLEVRETVLPGLFTVDVR